MDILFSTTLGLMSISVRVNKEIFKSNTAGIYFRDSEKREKENIFWLVRVGHVWSTKWCVRSNSQYLPNHRLIFNYDPQYYPLNSIIPLPGDYSPAVSFGTGLVCDIRGGK